MKNRLLISAAIISAFINYSCKENFEPKTALDQKYVLSCLIKADSTFQTASLSKTYDVQGFDPYSNNVDPSVKGAQIYLKANGRFYQMRDTAIERIDTSRYKGPINLYYTKAFRPAANQVVEIVALPESGVTLSSKTTVPNGLLFQSSVNYMRESGTNVNISWKTTENDLIFVPRFKIVYMMRNENPSIVRTFEIPISVDVNGVYHYPQISRGSSLYFSSQMIDMSMRKLSEGKNKDDFRIIRLELEVQIFDQFLGNYLSSTTGFFDQLSIRLDEPNYTNITGGYGVFGAVMRDYCTIGVSESFLMAFGYSVTP